MGNQCFGSSPNQICNLPDLPNRLTMKEPEQPKLARCNPPSVSPPDCYYSRTPTQFKAFINGHLLNDHLYIWIVMDDNTIRYFDWTAWYDVHLGDITSTKDYTGHSSMLSAAEILKTNSDKTSPVLYGGQITGDSNGNVKKLDNHSGHFHPSAEYIKPIGEKFGVPESKITEITSAHYQYYNMMKKIRNNNKNDNNDNEYSTHQHMINMLNNDYHKAVNYHNNNDDPKNNNYYFHIDNPIVADSNPQQIYHGNYNNTETIIFAVLFVFLFCLICGLITCLTGAVIGYFAKTRLDTL